MGDFDPQFARTTAFQFALSAYTIAGFGERCTPPSVDGHPVLPDAFERQAVIRVDPTTCKTVWRDSSPATRQMLAETMSDALEFGFIAARETTVMIAFRGTRTLSDIMKDLHLHPVPGAFGADPDSPSIPGAVHEGFQAIYRTLRPSIKNAIAAISQKIPGLLLSITGHSLGAALATLCALDPLIAELGSTRPRVYTFASPRVGNPAFADAFDQSIDDCFRIVNMTDIVPHLPPRVLPQFGNELPFEYRHVGKAVTINGFRHSIDPIVDEHVLCGGYLRGLNVLTAIGGPRAVAEP